MSELIKIQDRMGIRFDDLSLLQRALTHRSYLNEHPEHALEDNERLEFLGDAVLDFVAGAWLYHRFPELDEGYLTRLRAGLVRTETLAGFAQRFHLGDALLLGRGEDDSGGRGRRKNLCGAFEAVIGAYYLDKGMDGLMKSYDKDAKSRFQEWSQASFGETPVYKTVSSRGPDHAKEFTVAVMVGTTEAGRGTGNSKQSAAQAAAQHALEAVENGEIVFDLEDHHA
jgi:ribonuclease III